MSSRTQLFAATILVSLSSTCFSATFIYEGFPAGGEFPAAGQYQSAPVSTNGVNNDSIQGQGPAGVGFDSGVNWSEDPVASTIYPQVLGAGLNYADTLGNTLNTVGGAMDWHRVSGSPFTKRESRATNLSPVLPNTGYFSALLKFTDGTFGQVELEQHNGSGGNDRDLYFGFNASGNLVAGTQNDGNNNNNKALVGSNVFSADSTYLLFGEVVNDGVEDDLRIWINPDDLSDPTAGTPEIDSTNAGSAWVGNNPSYTIRDLHLFANTTAGSQFVFDEIRVGDTAADVLPFTAARVDVVPEPASIAIWTMLGLCLAGYGYRRRK